MLKRWQLGLCLLMPAWGVAAGGPGLALGQDSSAPGLFAAVAAAASPGDPADGLRWGLATVTLFGAALLAWAWRQRRQRRQLARLRAAEARSGALLEHSFDATVVLHPDATIKYMSPGWARLLGVDMNRPGFMNGGVSDLIHPEDLPRIIEAHKQVLEAPGNTCRVRDYRVFAADGTVRHVEAIGRNCLHVPGVEGIVVNVHDVTERKRAEDELRRSEGLTRAINRFATSFLKQDSEDALLWDLAKDCIAQLGFVDCVVYLIDAEARVLVQRAAIGPKNPEGITLLNPLRIPLGEGIVGAAVEQRTPILVHDTRLDPRYIVDDERRLSELAVPIMTGEEVLGVIDSEHPAMGFFTPDHVGLLTSIASLCANRLVAMRAVRGLWEANARLEERVAERTSALSQSEERFSKAFQASPAMLSILRLPRGEYLDVNEAFLRTFGFTRDEVIGRTATALNIGRSAAAEETAWRSLERSGEPLRNEETRYRTRAGEPRVVLRSAELIQLGGERCALAVEQDITERQRVQTALAESEAHTRLIIDTALDAVVTMDVQGVIRGWNSQAEAIFGWSRREVLGRDLADTIIPPQLREGHRAGLRRFLDTGEGPVLNRRIELSALHQSGREFPAELTVTALRTGGAFIFSAFIRDITDRHLAQENLVRALEREKELHQLKNSFVSMVSHEFRTPLEVILSSSNILDRYLDRLAPEKRSAQLRAIRKSVRRMNDLLDEVLLLGRIDG
ncbi:MAG: PAS domain S-box protein [Verrucomicrobia bacterium]|nr:PAS domain S-box protein [Verrucomicrobiota bacterium]